MTPVRTALTGTSIVAVLLAGCGEAPPAVPFTGDPSAGRVALLAHDCGVCHEIPGVRSARGKVGPPLSGFGARVYIAGRFPNGEDMLVRWIVDPPAMEPLTPMPALGVSEADARDMAAYLLSQR